MDLDDIFPKVLFGLGRVVSGPTKLSAKTSRQKQLEGLMGVWRVRLVVVHDEGAGTGASHA